MNIEVKKIESNIRELDEKKTDVIQLPPEPSPPPLQNENEEIPSEKEELYELQNEPQNEPEQLCKKVGIFGTFKPKSAEPSKKNGMNFSTIAIGVMGLTLLAKLI